MYILPAVIKKQIDSFKNRLSFSLFKRTNPGLVLTVTKENIISNFQIEIISFENTPENIN